MMKKIVQLLLVFTITLSICNLNVTADENTLINTNGNSNITVIDFTSECDSSMEGSGLGSAQATLDYNNNTYWHSQWGEDANRVLPQYITYDLSKAYFLTSIAFLPKQSGEYINGDIFEVKVYVSSDTTFNDLDLVDVFSINEHNEINLNTRNFYHLPFDQAYYGRYVKFEVTKSGSHEGANMYASMAEIRFYGSEKSNVNKDELNQVMKQAQALDLSLYDEASVTMLQNVLNSAIHVYNDENALQSSVDEVKQALQDTLALMQLKKVDKSELQQLVDEALKLDLSLYQNDSVLLLQEALSQAQNVLNNEQVSQQQVDDAKDQLLLAKNNLQEKVNDVDKSKLEQLLNDISRLDLTKYQNASIQLLQEQYLKAQAVFNDSNVTQQDVDYAYEQLKKVQSELKLKTEKVMNFYDVQNPKAWYYKVVEQAYQKDLMGATGKQPVNGQPFFEPDANITRGMVATVLYRMANKPKVAFKVIFSDVTNASLWYSTAITWASQNNVVSGYKDGSFGPDDNITRQDLAIMLRNYAKANGLDTNVSIDFSAFKDGEKIVSYAQSAVQFCIDTKLMSGSKKADGIYLMPRDNATRAQCAKMFSLLDEAIKKDDF